MRVLVCGSRTWSEGFRIHKELATLLIENRWKDLVVIEGGAKGADQIAGLWALAFCEYGVEHLCFPAHGKRAGNQQMLNKGKPDLVLAFWDGKSRGTGNMIKLARKAGISVKVILEDS